MQLLDALLGSKMELARSRERLLDGWKHELKNSNEFFSHTITHPGERGIHGEAALRKILRAVLPQKVGLGTGFIEFPNSGQSSQQDIVLFDAVNHAPLYANDDWQVYPPEMVLATIEVKTTLAGKDLCTAFESCQRIRKNSQERKFLRQDNSNGRLILKQVSLKLPAPRFFLFCYHSGAKKFETFKKRLIATSKQFPKSHVHGICVLDQDWFFHRKAYDGETHQYHGVESGGWRKFLMTIYPILLFPDSSLIADRSAYLTGVTPDQVELGFTAPARPK
jgi:hypothetical protein